MRNKLHLVAPVAVALFASTQIQAQTVTLNPGFEITDAGFPGGAQNWYGYTNTGAAGTLAEVTQEAAAVYAGTNGFLLQPVSTGTFSQATLGSSLWAISAGSTNTLSFELKFLGATAGSVWGEYRVGFFDSSFSNISFTANQPMPYSWDTWTNITYDNLVAPSGTAYAGADFFAYAGDTGNLRIAIDDVNLNSVPEPSTYALLALSSAALAGYRLRRRTR
jgi:hypothetical protein